LLDCSRKLIGFVAPDKCGLPTIRESARNNYEGVSRYQSPACLSSFQNAEFFLSPTFSEAILGDPEASLVRAMRHRLPEG